MAENGGPQGLAIRRISEDEFRAFAERHATSPEIGDIRTYFDADAENKRDADDVHLLGLTGCGKICAVSCCTIKKSKTSDTHACKLDSVIVDGALRRHGLATVLVARAFLDLLDDPDFRLTTFYAHSVHPASVRMLRTLAFRDPPPVGAPISSLQLDDGDRNDFAATCRERFNTRSGNLKRECALCVKGNRRARPWCGKSRK